MVQTYQNHESLRLVIAEALGGSTESKGPSKNDVKPVQTYEELVAAWTGLGGMVGG